MMNLLNKVVLITGASGQLGRQFCKVFAERGAIVWASDLDIEECEKVIETLINSKSHHPLTLDVSSPKSVKDGFKKILKITKPPNIIINNAGIAVFSSFRDRTFDDFMNVMKVNAGGTFLCIQEASRLMIKHEIKGSIINIGSIYGMVSGDPSIYTDCNRNTSECYGASKAAIIHMSKYFSVHLSNYNIRVNCISPGGVFNNQGEDFVRKYSSHTPLGRMANENEIADAAIFLASDDSSYITGQNIAVDGGWTSW